MSDVTERAGESVLGTLLNFYKPELVTIVQARGITWSDFGPDKQQVLYRAVLALHREGASVDPLSVEAFLEPRRDEHGRGMLERAGGRAYLAYCVGVAVPSALREHAFIVAEGGRWRRLASAWEFLGRAIEQQQDGQLREAVALVKRDVVDDEAPKLRVVGGQAA